MPPLVVRIDKDGGIGGNMSSDISISEPRSGGGCNTMDSDRAGADCDK